MIKVKKEVAVMRGTPVTLLAELGIAARSLKKAGVPCLLTVTHTENDNGNVFANISSISKVLAWKQKLITWENHAKQRRSGKYQTAAEYVPPFAGGKEDMDQILAGLDNI